MGFFSSSVIKTDLSDWLFKVAVEYFFPTYSFFFIFSVSSYYPPQATGQLLPLLTCHFHKLHTLFFGEQQQQYDQMETLLSFFGNCPLRLWRIMSCYAGGGVTSLLVFVVCLSVFLFTICCFLTVVWCNGVLNFIIWISMFCIIINLFF